VRGVSKEFEHTGSPVKIRHNKKTYVFVLGGKLVKVVTIHFGDLV
jgi:hypothetical protein